MQDYQRFGNHRGLAGGDDSLMEMESNKSGTNMFVATNPRGVVRDDNGNDDDQSTIVDEDENEDLTSLDWEDMDEYQRTYVRQSDMDKRLIRKANTGNERKLYMCLAQGANVESRDAKGRTALMISATKGNTQAMQHLLSYGASVHTVDPSGRTALWYTQNPDIVASFIQLGARLELTDSTRSTALLHFASTGNLEVMDLLLRAGCDIDARDEKGRTPLMMAAASASADTCFLLLARGANTRARDYEGNSALVSCVEFHGDYWDLHLDKFSMLLERGFDVNVQNNMGNSALMVAAYHGYHGLVSMLVSAGANLNLRNWNGDSALMLAIRTEYYRTETFDMMLERVSGLYSPAKQAAATAGSTPGSKASAAMAAFLVTKGADVRFQNNHGETAYDIAVKEQKADIAQWLGAYLSEIAQG